MLFLSRQSNRGKFNMTVKQRSLLGASLVSISAYIYGPAFAQTAVSEVIVVATGREANVQDIPTAVTAIDAFELDNAGITEISRLERVTPSFHIWSGESTVQGTVALIRGIGTSGNNPGFESAVGVFVDGIYRSRPATALSLLQGLERVEIVRGPQGTLFGRNTSAGAVSLFTTAPDYTFSAWGSAGLGDLSFFELSGGTNLPLNDSVALRFDGAYQSRDGYVGDINDGRKTNDRDRWLLRGQAMFDISPQASLRVIVDGSRTNENCCAATPLIYGSLQYVVEAIAGPNATLPSVENTSQLLERRNTDISDRKFAFTPDRSYAESAEDWGASAELNWSVDFADFTSITAYRDWSATRSQDADFSLIDIAYRDGEQIEFKTFTQEMRLQGVVGRLDWLAGLFYGNEKLYTTDRIRLGRDMDAYVNGAVQFLTTSVLGAPFELYDTTFGDDDHPFPNIGVPPFPPPAIPGSGGLDPVPSLFYAAGLDPSNPLPTSIFENLYLSLPTPTGSGQQADRWAVDTKTYALFTHNEFSVTDELILAFGLRYSHEEKNLSADLLSVSPACANLQAIEAATGGLVDAMLASPAGAALNLACNPVVNPVANGMWTGDRNDTAWSGTSSLTYHINDDLMVYGSYARGFKSGGYNVDRSGFALKPSLLTSATLSTDQISFDPEYTDAYELGFKSTLFEGLANFNVALFYETIKDFQLNAFNGTNFTTRNVPRLISRGVEVDVAANPFDGLSVLGGLVYNEAFYDSTVVFNPASPAGNTVFKNAPLDHAPKWVVTSAVTYEWPIIETLMARLHLDGRWSSSYRNQTLARDPLGRTDQEAYAVFNARASVGSPSGSWTAAFWVNNIADKFYTLGAFEAPLQPGTYVIYPGESRTFGVTLSARY
jgi:iron complex outermembrane receptor protein